MEQLRSRVLGFLLASMTLSTCCLKCSHIIKHITPRGQPWVVLLYTYYVYVFLVNESGVACYNWCSSVLIYTLSSWCHRAYPIYHSYVVSASIQRCMREVSRTPYSHVKTDLALLAHRSILPW